MIIKDKKDIIYVALTKQMKAKVSPTPFEKGMSVGFRPITNKEFSEYYMILSNEDTIERSNKLVDFISKLIVEIKGKNVSKDSLTLAILFPMIEAVMLECIITEEDDIFLD